MTHDDHRAHHQQTVAHGEHHASDHHDHGGHGHHGGHEGHAAMFRDRFYISLALSIVVIVYSEMIQEWFGFTPPLFPGSEWVAPVLGTVLFFYGGRPFLTEGYREAVDRRPGMMLLIAMAITVAFLASAATTLGWFELDFWWELAALITIMLLGHWMEMRAIGQAQGALSALAELIPDHAERLGEAGSETVPVDQLNVGDLVLVRPGGRIPADGEIVEGVVEVDESMVTGESNPVGKGPGDGVTAGTVVTDNPIRVRVTAVGEHTALAGIQRLVAEAQESKSRAQVLADRAAALLFYVALASAAITAVVWLAVGQPGEAVSRTVAVLVIACPHALGLAIPLVIAISTGLAARNGILVKDRLSLERMRQVDVVLFDKTGTLTRGDHRVTGVASVPGVDRGEVLALAAAAESESEHPLGRAIMAAAGPEWRDLTVAHTRSMSGRGVEAIVDGTPVAVGGPNLLRERGLDVPDDLADPVSEWEGRGAAVLYVILDDQVVAGIGLEDRLREESAQAVDRLVGEGLEVALITGDSSEVAHAVASDLGIAQVFAEVLPEDKHAAVSQIQEQGRRVAMVGDGVNDAPALAQADVGVAIGAGTGVAIESAGIVLASDDPRGVVSVRHLSEASHRKMVQNLIWATGYNVIAIPLAAGTFAWAGLILPPAAAAILMSLSTVVVAINALLLNRLDLSW